MGLYDPYTGYTNNLIPVMTSNTSPEGVCSASSEYSSSYQAWKAADKKLQAESSSSLWISTNADAPDAWWEYNFSSVKVITQYTLTARTDTTAGQPKDWTFEGFNGSDWDVLDTVTGEVSWGLGEKRVFQFSNIVNYAKYRINVTNNNGGTTVNFVEIEMMESVPQSTNIEISNGLLETEILSTELLLSTLNMQLEISDLNSHVVSLGLHAELIDVAGLIVGHLLQVEILEGPSTIFKVYHGGEWKSAPIKVYNPLSSSWEEVPGKVNLSGSWVP